MFWPGDELEYLRPNVYRNVARQLNITVASENIVSDAFLAVAADIFSTGGSTSESGCVVNQASHTDCIMGTNFSALLLGTQVENKGRVFVLWGKFFMLLSSGKEELQNLSQIQ